MFDLAVVRATPLHIDTVLDLVDRLLTELSHESSLSSGLDRAKIAADLSGAADRWIAFLAVDGNARIGVITTTEAVAAYAGGRYSVAFYERNGFVFTGRKLKLLLQA